MFRGDPDFQYIDSVKLEGNTPGHAVPIKSKSDCVDHADARNAKTPWTEKERTAAMSFFKTRIASRLSAECTLKLIDNRRPFEAADYADALLGLKNTGDKSGLVALLLFAAFLFVWK